MFEDLLSFIPALIRGDLSGSLVPCEWLKKVHVELFPKPTLPPCYLPASSLAQQEWRQFECPSRATPVMAAHFEGKLNVGAFTASPCMYDTAACTSD